MKLSGSVCTVGDKHSDPEGCLPTPKDGGLPGCRGWSDHFLHMAILSTYNQIPMRPDDIYEMAMSKYRLFECRTIAFGLTNAPATFRRPMEVGLVRHQFTSCLIYLGVHDCACHIYCAMYGIGYYIGSQSDRELTY